MHVVLSRGRVLGHTVEHTNGHADCDEYADAHTDQYTYANAYTTANAHTDTDAHADRDADIARHGDADRLAVADGHAHAGTIEHADARHFRHTDGVAHTDDHAEDTLDHADAHTYPHPISDQIGCGIIPRAIIWDLTDQRVRFAPVRCDMNREEAWQIVTEFTASDSLRKHMLSVEAAMRAYAPRFNGDVELWGTIGLLHDFDYERYPDIAVDGHPVVGSKILRERGVSEEIIRCILSHATEVSGVQRVTPMEKTLFAVDELTGLITATALVRPSKNIADVTVSSVKKKWKDKAFAAGVDRTEIEHAATDLGVPLDEHIDVVLRAMQAIAPTLGLDGSLAR